MYPNSVVPSSLSIEEAKMAFMSNRQLMSQLQQQASNSALPFGQQTMNRAPRSVPLQQQQQQFKPPSGHPNALGQMFKPSEPSNGMQNGYGQMIGNPNSQSQRGPSPGPLQHQGMSNGQAALMQALLQGQYGGVDSRNIGGFGVGGFLNQNSMAAAAATVAATQQAAQARAAQAQQQSNQARVAAYMQQQQNGQNMAQQQAGGQQQQWLSAAMQRALASGQLVMQNGKPVLMPAMPLGNSQQQQQQPNVHPSANAEMLQQIQVAQQAAAAAQKQAAQQMTLMKLGMAYGMNDQVNQRSGGPGVPSQTQLQAALLKQAQMQDAMSGGNGRPQQQQHGGGMPGLQQAMMGGASGYNTNQNSQQQQVQHAQAHAMAQLRIRQNMTALANLPPNQLQAISNNPALSQFLLQARTPQQQQGVNPQQQQQQQQMQQIQQMAAAFHQQQGGANLQQQMQQQHQGPPQIAAPPISIPEWNGGGDPWLKHQPGAGSGGIMPEIPPDSVSSGGATSPPGGMTKEHRRMALACVALQLAHTGVSIDQAIHSGIMGGMSVTDIRFIMNVHSAEVARMKAQGIAPEGPEAAARAAAALGITGGNTEAFMRAAASLGGTQNRSRSTVAASTGSVTLGSSRAGSEAGGFVRSDSGTGYGEAPSQSRSRASSVVGTGYGEAPSLSRSRASSVVGADRPGSVASAAANLQALSDPAGGFDNDAFNAFSYGFFGGVPVEDGPVGNALLEELGGLEEELDGKLLGELGEEVAWMADSGMAPDWSTLSNALVQQHLDPSALHALDESQGQGEETDVFIKQDDVATRLANLDLGSGFF